MTNTELTAYLPYYGSSYSDDPIAQYIEDTLEELGSLSGKLELPLDAFGIARPLIESIESTEETESLLEQWTEVPLTGPKPLLKISATVPLPEEPIYSTDLKGENRQVIEGEQAIHSYKTFAREVFKKRMYDIIVVTNIARVGSLTTAKGLLVQDGEKHPIDEMNGAYDLGEAWDYIEDDVGWPTITTLGISTVWDWAIRQRGFLTGFGGGPTGRALNAFTYLFGSGDAAAQLFWMLVGIEAIYTKGQGSLQEQVRDKSQTLLGRQETHKKKIGQMYGFRSRFIHGDLEIGGRHEVFDATDESMRHIRELFDSLHFAVAILVATFQELVQRNWGGVQFTYGASESPE